LNIPDGMLIDGPILKLKLDVVLTGSP